MVDTQHALLYLFIVKWSETSGSSQKSRNGNLIILESGQGDNRAVAWNQADKRCGCKFWPKEWRKTLVPALCSGYVRLLLCRLLVLVVLTLACQHISCLTFGFSAIFFFWHAWTSKCRPEGTMWEACFSLVNLINNMEIQPGQVVSCWVQNERKLLGAMFFSPWPLLNCFTWDCFGISMVIYAGCVPWMQIRAIDYGILYHLIFFRHGQQ